MISQAGDGIFTAGLGTYVFFNVATYPTPAQGAAAFAVLYAPYSLVGPFAGVFIDRWSRRQILVYSGVLRFALVLLTAALMASGNRSLPLYIAVLLVLGVSRFALASLSAALPHVVAGDKLVMGNAVSPTAGGIMAALGGIAGLGVNVATGDTERGAAITVLVAGLCYIASGAVARIMRKDLLGPVREPGQYQRGRITTEVKAVAAGLAAGARHIFSRRGPAAALGATGGNRSMYGILLLTAILLYRNYFYYGAKASVGEGHFTILVTISGIGYFCAALVTPPVTRRLAKPAVITLMLAASAVVTGVLGPSFEQVAFLAIGFCINLASQAVGICATTILQEQVDDEYRGRAFSFYDMLFNLAYAAGALVAAPFLPKSGKSAVLIVIVAAGYAVVAAAYWLAGRHSAGRGVGGSSIPAEAAQSSSS
jgi:MFS family permease